MSKKRINTSLSPELMEYLKEELEYIDPEYAKLKFYQLLLDKYRVPSNHSLRTNTQHHLPVDSLDTLLRDLGFSSLEKLLH